MKKTAKDSKKKQVKVKDMPAKKNVKGGTTVLTDRNGTIAGSGGKVVR